MKGTAAILVMLLTFAACKLSSTNQVREDNTELAALFNRYNNERMELFPADTAQLVDTLHNDSLYTGLADSSRAKRRAFYSKYLTYLAKYDRDVLNTKDQRRYDSIKQEMEIRSKGLAPRNK